MKPTLFSISYAGFWGQDSLPLDEFIPRAARLGYESVMLAGKRPNLSPLDATEEKIAGLKTLLAENNLTCSVIGAYTDFSASPSEVPYVEFQIQYVESLAKIAAEIGAEQIRIFSAYHRDGNSLTEGWQRMVDVIREVADRCSAHGVGLALQNHHDFAVATPALLEFLHDVDRPNLKLGFDAWSPALRGEDLYEAAKAAAPHTAITTNADYVRFPQFKYIPDRVNYEPDGTDITRAVPFGDGFIDFDAFFGGLKDGGFDGVSTYEMCSPLRGGGSLENLDRCAEKFVSWNRERGFIS